MLLVPVPDWLKNLVPLFHPIRSETKTRYNSFSLIFLHFASGTIEQVITLSLDWLNTKFSVFFCDSGLEITVRHRTLSDQILNMSGQFHIMIRHDVRTFH